jgi:hypothetical protein
MSSMRELLERHLAAGLDEFKGLHITGSIPVRQEIINEVLAELVQHGTAARPTDGRTVDAPAFGVSDALRLVTRAEVKAHAGSITVEFELRV